MSAAESSAAADQEQLDINDWTPFGAQIMQKNTVVKVMGETHRLAVWNLPSDQETKKEKQILYLPGVKAFSLHWDDLAPMIKEGFWVTGKTDGIRALLKIEKYAVYLLSRTAGVWRMKNKRAEKELQDALPNTLLDGELLPTPTVIRGPDGVERPGPSHWTFMAFDCVQFRGEPVAHFNFKDRYARVNECVRAAEAAIAARPQDLAQELDGAMASDAGVWIKLATKLWVPACRIEEVLRGVQMIDEEENGDSSSSGDGDNKDGNSASKSTSGEHPNIHRTDGLILMNPASHYKHHERNRPLLKWKPKHTIDLIGFFHRRGPNNVYCPPEDDEGLGQTGEWVRLYEYVVVRGARGPTPGALQIHCVAEEKEEMEWLEYVGSAPANDLWRGLVRHYAQPGMAPRNCLVMEVSLDPATGGMEMILARADKKTAPNWNQVVKDTLHSLSENITLPELSYIFHHSRDLWPGSFPGVTNGAAGNPQDTQQQQAGAAGRKRDQPDEGGESGAAGSDDSSAEESQAKRQRLGDGSAAGVSSSSASSSAAEEEKSAHDAERQLIPPKPDFERSRQWQALVQGYSPESLFFLHLIALTLEHWRVRPELELEARLCLQNKPGAALSAEQFLNGVLPRLLADRGWQRVEFQLIYEESRGETSGKVRMADIRKQSAFWCAQRRRWMLRALEQPVAHGETASNPNMPTLGQLRAPASLRELKREAECVRKSEDRLQSLAIQGTPFAVRVSTKKEAPLAKLQAQAEEALRAQGGAQGAHFLQGVLGMADGGRCKSRWSFIRKGIRYDMSQVLTNDNRGSHTSYEAEVELMPELRNDAREGLQPPPPGMLYGMPHLVLAHRLHFKVLYLLNLLPNAQKR